MTTSSYHVVQEPDNERWIITNGSVDDPLIWQGSHWTYRDQCPALISFANREQAERYAHVVFGGGE